jgi:hypothetical protein
MGRYAAFRPSKAQVYATDNAIRWRRARYARRDIPGLINTVACTPRPVCHCSASSSAKAQCYCSRHAQASQSCLSLAQHAPIALTIPPSVSSSHRAHPLNRNRIRGRRSILSKHDILLYIAETATAGCSAIDKGGAVAVWH